jgi:hypothetical protein
VAGYAVTLLIAPETRPPFVRNLAATTPLALYGHLAGGAIALILGPVQFVARLRSRWLEIHRWSGRGYIIGVFVGGAAGLLLAMRATGGPVAQSGFGCLASAWLISTAATLRFYLPTSIALGASFDQAYPAIAWLCWMPNLAIAEWLIRRH